MSKNTPAKEMVEQKLKNILQDVQRIEALLSEHTYEEIITNEEITSLAERRLERIINRAIDINLHLLRANNTPPPEDYTRSFLELASIHILTPKLSKNIAPCVGIRNILVHEYDDIDAALFYSSLKDAVKYFPKYAKEIQACL